MIPKAFAMLATLSNTICSISSVPTKISDISKAVCKLCSTDAVLSLGIAMEMEKFAGRVASQNLSKLR